MRGKQKMDSQQLKHIALTMRYGSGLGIDNQGPFATYKDIASMLGLSIAMVQQICSSSNLNTPDEVSSARGRKSILTEEHIQYLIDKQTLESWCSRSLRERVKNGIKRKVIVHKKIIKLSNQEKHRLEVLKLRSDFQKLSSMNNRILLVDEAMFTRATLSRLAYSRKRENQQLNEMILNTPPIALVAAVSREHGLEAWKICDRSLNSDSFIDFLSQIEEKLGQTKPIIFMDNCRVHHSRKVSEYMKEKGLRSIFNVAYSPQFNPIETYWSLIKRTFKNAKLRALQDGANIIYLDLIKWCLKQIPDDVIMRICHRVSQKYLL